MNGFHPIHIETQEHKKNLETRGRAIFLAPRLRSIVTSALVSWNRLMRSAFVTSFTFGG
jgi:hypothetical protein